MSVSAISTVKNTGYELVKTRKRRGKFATMRDYANLEFSPWSEPKSEHAGETIQPTDKTMAAIGFSVRSAAILNARTKEFLINMVGKMPDDLADKMMTDFAEDTERLKAMVLIIDQAYLRILSAASAAELGKTKAKRSRRQKPRGRKAVAS